MANPNVRANSGPVLPIHSSNRPPLLFHNVHGENVRLTSNNRLASRTDSFCKALVFSNRAIGVDETVFIRFAEVKSNWSGVLRFGVTNTNPATLGADVPKYACPDMTSKEGTWAKAVGDRYCQQGSIMHFFVRDNGEMFYGVNGQLRGLFLSGINTRIPMFIVIDIYGNTTSVEFVDESEVPGFAGPTSRRPREPQATPVQATPVQAAVPPPPSIRPPEPPITIPTQPSPVSTANSSPREQPVQQQARPQPQPQQSRPQPQQQLQPQPQPQPQPQLQPRQQQQQPDATVTLAQQQLARELEQRLNFSQHQQRSMGTAPPTAVAMSTSTPMSMSTSTATSTSTSTNTGASSSRRQPDLTTVTYNRNVPITPLQFHTTRGRSVGLNNDRTIASRATDEYCCGYVFTSRPVRFMEKIIIQILGVQNAYTGGLAFGVTNCDPSLLTNYTFPDDADELMNRPEFWAVNKDYEKQPSFHDELTFFLNERGEVVYQKNNDAQRILMHVDPSLTYYMFFDVYGRAQSIQCIGTTDARRQAVAPPAPTLPQNRRRQRQNERRPPANLPQYDRVPGSNSSATTMPPAPPPAAILQQFQLLQGQSHQQQHGRAGLTVTMPPAPPPPGFTARTVEPSRPPQTMATGGPATQSTFRPAPSRHDDHHGRYVFTRPPPRPTRPPPPAPPHRAHSVPTSQQMASNAAAPSNQISNTSTLSRPASTTAVESRGNVGPPATGTSTASGAPSSGTNTAGTATGGTVGPLLASVRPNSECSVCMDQPINCAVYPCGHMCMCYECGRTTWNRQGVCPICRQNIRDILRLFPSS